MAQRVALQLPRGEDFGGIGDGAEVSPSSRELPVALGLFTVIHTLFALRVAAVVVVLVHCGDDRRSIYNR